MAITVQSELVSAVQNWLARTDLSSARCAEFIALAEAKLNRQLRTTAQETKVTNVSISAEYVAVPTGFLEVRSFESTTGGTRYALKQLPDEIATTEYPDTGIPLFFTVVGTNFRFTPVPSATQTSVLVYYAILTALGTTANNTNWLLTSHPDVYLYGTLLEAAAYVQTDPTQLQIWKAAYDEGVAYINKSSTRNRWGGPGLVQRPG